MLSSLESNFRTLTILNADALKANDTASIALISRGIASHKMKVVSWSNRNRKTWRKKVKGGGGGGGGAGAAASDDLISLASMSGAVGMGTAGGEGEGKRLKPTLETKDIEKASELLDQLKGIFTQ